MKKILKMQFNKNIFNLSILDMIKKEINSHKENDYYDYDYDVIIRFNYYDLKNNNFLKNISSYWRPWHDNYTFLEKTELALRIAINNIKECIEDCNLEINQIFIENDKQIKHTEIQIIKIKLHNYEDKIKNQEKIHLNIDTLDNKHITKIIDPINFSEYEFYIDERNNNKKFYNSLLSDKQQGKNLKIENLSEQDWKQLVLKEKITTKELANLYNLTEYVITKNRKKFIPNIKEYNDEYLFYYIMFHSMTLSDYYSNFSIPLLEQMKTKKIKVIYEYLNLDYHEIIFTEQELKRQKEIEKNNLAGKRYVMPLSGILLKKLYWAIKHNQLDKKIFKSDWFNTYYGTMFLKNLIEQIEESEILDLYENANIYKHPSFMTYEKLYKKLNLEETEKIQDQIPTKIPILENQAFINKVKTRKIYSPKDHINLAKIKNKIGRTGEELAYNYELAILKEYPKLQKKIEKTYLIDEGAGYDIKSYDFNGNAIFIEVKTNKSNGKNRIKFYISKNEDEFISNNKNAFIYYIYDLDNPKLRIIDQKTYLQFYKKTITFEIDQKIL